MKDEIYPLIIINDRYSGIYSGGNYIAWHCDLEEVPIEQELDDVKCRNFWLENEKIPLHGKGKTIEEAIEDLRQKINLNILEHEKCTF